MRTRTERGMHIRYCLFLAAIVVGFAFYLLPYTVFEGFATLGNDAATYVLMARKWSPFYEPTSAEVFTEPVHLYPPAFPLLLAVTGASESLAASHLVVSLCLLATVLLMGLYVGRQSQKLIAGVTVAAVCTIPGIVIHTLGILSENLFMLVSLATLVVYNYVRNRDGANWAWHSLLFILLTTALLTRTVGIALVAAFLVVPVLDRTLIRRQRVILPIMAIGAVIVWRLWEAARPSGSGIPYSEYLIQMLNSSDGSFLGLSRLLWESVRFNTVRLLGGWAQYFALQGIGVSSFLLAYLFFMLSAAGVVLRAVRMRLDAIYLLLYLGIMLVWQSPEALPRYLHPVVMLLLVQPVVLLSERGWLKKNTRISYSVVGMAAILVIHSAFIHANLISAKQRAEEDFPGLVHSLEYYLATPENNNLGLAQFYLKITELMIESKKSIPEESVVAAVKHENFALIANRKAVTLIGMVSSVQQLCNLHLEDVDVVYLSRLITGLNVFGPTLRESYEEYASDVETLESTDGSERAYIMTLDKSAIARELEDSGFACQRFRYNRLEPLISD